MLHLLALSAASAGTLSGLVTANGHGAAVYEVDGSGYGVVSRFSDHLYQQASPDADPTWDLLYDTYFGLRAEGTSGWLTQTGGETVEVGTGILAVDRSRGALAVTEYVVAPMTLGRPAFVHLLHVRNDGAAAIADVQAFSLHNYHLGADRSGANTGDERLEALDGGLVEVGDTTGLAMHLRPLVAPTRTGCADVWATVNAGGDLGGACGGTGDDRVGGFQWSLGTLDPGEEAWVGTVDAFASGWDTGATVPDAIAGWVDGRSPAALLDAERADWAAWHTPTPAGLDPSEAEVYRQALAWLRMAQVREEGDAHGQIVASLPYADGAFSHVWNIAWARDGAYAIRALAEAGHPEEAAAALRFLAQEGKSGGYADYLGGVDYIVSVCRYYGDGTEWSDDDGLGPNIELDDWGLYLWALGGAVDAGATELLADEVPRALDGVADPLVALIDATGLIVADSSIWERHWNGSQKHFTYTSAWAVRGLREAARLADAVGDPRADGYRAAADGIAATIAAWLVDDDGVLLGNAEEARAYALDLAAADAFNNGALDVDDAGPSLAAWEALRVPAGGWMRNDDGDLYDRQEWLFVDLRMAELQARSCRLDDADATLDRVTALASANDGVLPELLDPETGEVEGPAPMIGFGAGVYVLAQHAREAASCQGDTSDPDDTGVPDTGAPDDTGDTGREDTGDTATDALDTGDPAAPGATPEGCGCAANPTPGRALAAAFAAALALAARRRPSAR